MEPEEELEKIAEEVRVCTKCPLCKSRKNAVPGEGSIKRKIMIIGEAPGFNEDVQGRPFVGKAGMLLEKFLFSIGLRREEVFITNIVKCRPPKNRQPREEEIEACSDYLNRQIEIIKPKLIICLGNVSAKNVLKKFGINFESMNRMHGKVFSISNLQLQVKIISTFHPAAILRNNNLLSLAKNDWEKIKEVIE